MITFHLPRTLPSKLADILAQMEGISLFNNKKEKNDSFGDNKYSTVFSAFFGGRCAMQNDFLKNPVL